MASLPPGVTPEEIRLLKQKDENHDVEVYTIVAVFTALAISATVLRLTSRHMKKVAVGIDDVLILIGLTISVAESIYIAVGVDRYGLGRHLLTLDLDQRAGFQKLWYSVGQLQPTALMVTKLSVLILYYRIFIQRYFRISTWIVGVVVVLWWIGTFFADTFICTPVEANWNPNIEGRCGSKLLVGILTPIPWIVTDLIILLMPLPMVWKLHLPTIQRIGLGGLFLLGGFALVSSCVRYSTLFFDRKDVTWNIIPSTTWTVIECNITIVSACLIVSRPWFLKLYPEKAISTIRRALRSSRSGSNHNRTAETASKTRKWPLVSNFARLPDSAPKITEKPMGGTRFELDIEGFAGRGEESTRRNEYDD